MAPQWTASMTSTHTQEVSERWRDTGTGIASAYHHSGQRMAKSFRRDEFHHPRLLRDTNGNTGRHAPAGWLGGKLVNTIGLAAAHARHHLMHCHIPGTYLSLVHSSTPASKGQTQQGTADG